MNEGTILLEFRIPTEWPPSVNTFVYRGIHDGSTISVEACNDAKLRFTCMYESGIHEYITPKLQMPGFANLKAAFAWGPSDSMVAINGVLFSDEACSSDEVIALVSKEGAITRLREPLVLIVPSGLELAEERFMRSLIELQARILQADRVNLLEASAILRRLLMDAHPLVNRVNRNYKLRLRYPAAIIAELPSSDPVAAYQYINLSPPQLQNGSIAEYSLDEFLALTVITGNRSYSVRDVIDYCANTKGGVHFDDPRSIASAELLELDTFHFPEFIDASLHAIADFSWCVIQAMRPLAIQIGGRYATA